jgi:hypothetical protein
MSTRHHAVLLGLAALALAAGCGTTVPSAQLRAAQGDGLGGPGAATATADTGGTAAAPGTATAASSSLASTTGATGSSLAAGAGTAGSGSSASAGTTVVAALPHAAPVKVGVLYLTGVDTVAGALGISGLTTGDTRAQAAAVFAWAAAHGGFGGHQPSVSYQAIAAQDAANNNQAAQQAACTALTQDDHVRYVVTILQLLPSTMDCFVHAGVGVLDDASGLSDTAMAADSGQFEAPGTSLPGGC